MLIVSSPLPAETLRVSAAASLTDVLRELGGRYERRTGDKVQFNFGASNLLARQIERGAPADLFLSADSRTMEELAKSGRIDQHSLLSFIGNRLVVIVPAGSRQRVVSSRDLAGANVRLIALADTRTVPVGVYARNHLERIGIWQAVQKKVVPAANARAALAVTAAGNVDAAIVFETDARATTKVRVVARIAAAESDAIRYPFALTTNANQKIARNFLQFLASRESRRVFLRHGFTLH